MKNIKLSILLMLVGFISCSEDISTDKQLPTGESTTLDFVISSSNVMTKANIAEGYTWATEDELNINDCIIALFKKDGGTWKKQFIEYRQLNDGDKVTVSESDPRLAYKIKSQVTLSFDSAYMVKVIANPLASNVNTYKNCSSWEDFKWIEEGSDRAYTFDPKKLVKVGDLEMGKNTLTPLDHTTTRLLIPLTQLAARIDLRMKVSLKDEVEKWGNEHYVIYNAAGDSVSVNGIMEALAGMGNAKGAYEEALRQFAKYGITARVSELNESGEALTGRDLYYYDTPVKFVNESGNGYQGVKIEALKAYKVEERIGDLLGNLSVKILNIRTNARVYAPKDEADMNLLAEEDITSFRQKDGKYIFYTYSRSLGTPLPLKVAFNGGVYKKTVRRQTPVKTDWIILSDNYDDAKNGNSPIRIKTGWSGTYPPLFLVQRNGWTVDGSLDITEDITSGDLPYATCNKEFEIAPTLANGGTDGVLPGNLYDLSVIITKIDKDAMPTLNYSVVPWTPSGMINIPFN